VLILGTVFYAFFFWGAAEYWPDLRVYGVYSPDQSSERARFCGTIVLEVAMRFSKRQIVLSAAILAATFAWGQQPDVHLPADSSLLVRMSFASSWEFHGFVTGPQVCFSVNRSGHYQMRRVTTKTTIEPREGAPNGKAVVETPQTEYLQGTLAVRDLENLKKFVGDPNLLKLTVVPPSIVRKGGETFVAEIANGSRTRRIVVSDADGENPFPDSAEKIVDWLEGFKAEGARPLDVSTEDICPTGTMQPIAPDAARLEPSIN
jgi:hypothetical protein